MSNIWTCNGIALPRNPSQFSLKLAKSNVSYQDMLDGSQRRQRLGRKSPGRDIDLQWAAVSPSERNLLLGTFVSDVLSVVEIGGLQPRRTFNAWFDDWEDPMTKEVYDPTVGFGGIRYDMKITGRMDIPFLYSYYNVPNTPSLLSDIQNWFGGPTLTAADGLPVWQGNNWVVDIDDGSQVVTVENLGSGNWSPIIRVNGPFNYGMTINFAGVDVDGTGMGVTWIWSGSNVVDGDYVTIDMYKTTTSRTGTLCNTWALVTEADQD